MALPDYNNPQNGIPTDRVLQMRTQGLSNNQIIQGLQRDGYNQTQIFDALNQADIKGGVEQVKPGAINFSQPSNPMAMGSGMPPISGLPSPQQFGPPPAQANLGPPSGMPDINSLDQVTTEELIESIIDEKWNILVKDVNKIIDWKEKQEENFIKMTQEFQDIKKSFDSLHKAVVGKVGEYDKHILDVGAEIQAMEKVFQKVLPAFTENVRELSRITDNVKRVKQ